MRGLDPGEKRGDEAVSILALLRIRGMDNERFVTGPVGLLHLKACSDCRLRTRRVMKRKNRRKCTCFHTHKVIESGMKARQHAPVTG